MHTGAVSRGQSLATSLITALVDITMDRMEQEVTTEFTQMDNATRTALAFVKEATSPPGSPC